MKRITDLFETSPDDFNASNIAGSLYRRQDRQGNVSRRKFLTDLQTLLNNNLTLCPLHGKKPAYDLLRRGDKPLKSLDQDPPGKHEVLSWLERSSDEKPLNFGIRTTRTSNPNPDLDGHLAVLDWDKPFAQNFLDLPETIQVKTNQGFHSYYYVPNGSDLRNNSGKEQPLDVKTEGGYVVAPPSIHPEAGTPYEWKTDGPVDLSQVAELSPGDIGKINEFTENDGTQEATATVPAPNPKPVRETPPTGKHEPVNAEDWQALAGDPDVVEAVMEAIMEHSGRRNQEITVGNSFKSPLPVHSDSDQTGVALYKPDPEEVAGEPYFRLHDFHDRTDREFWSLPEVYASVVTGEMQDFTEGNQRDNGPLTGMVRIWWLRALDDAGIIKTPTIPAPSLPEDANRSVRKVYKGFIHLLELRRKHDSEQVGAPYSYRFAESWTGWSRSTVNRAMTKLMKQGFIQVKQENSSGANILRKGTREEVENARENNRTNGNEGESSEQSNSYFEDGVTDGSDRQAGDTGGATRGDRQRTNGPGSLESEQTRGDPGG